MPTVVWTGLSLFLVLLGSAVACASIIGMPITAEMQGLLALTAILWAAVGALLYLGPQLDTPGNPLPH